MFNNLNKVKSIAIISFFLLVGSYGFEQSDTSRTFIGRKIIGEGYSQDGTKYNRYLQKNLILKNNGTFKLNYSYPMYHNAVSNYGDYNAEGTWFVNNDTVILNTKFKREDVLKIEEQELQSDSIQFCYKLKWNTHHPLQLIINKSKIITLHGNDTVSIKKDGINDFLISFLDLETTFNYSIKSDKTTFITFSHPNDNGTIYNNGTFKDCKLIQKEDTLIPITKIHAINVDENYVKQITK